MLAGWAASSEIPVVDGGTYAQVRGPRFETRAEIRLLASFADLVGMTLAAECTLAGEAGLAYAALCIVDNLANGVGAGDPAAAYRETVARRDDALLEALGSLIATLAQQPLAEL